MVSIIDYGVGNISAFVNIYKQLNIDVKIAKKESDLLDADKIILPGVGHFDYAMQRLNDSGMKERVHELVTIEKKPVLGVCVGMQMMAARSDEGISNGLAWIDAEVIKFDEKMQSAKLPLPHMGWNDVLATGENPLLYNLEENARFYFLHSYYFKCNNSENSIAQSDYGARFTCAVNSENIYGAQFHPEKSHHYGITLLKNFAERC